MLQKQLLKRGRECRDQSKDTENLPGPVSLHLFCNADRGEVNSNLSQLQQRHCFREVTLEKEVPSRCWELMSAKPTQDVGWEG